MSGPSDMDNREREACGPPGGLNCSMASITQGAARSVLRDAVSHLSLGGETRERALVSIRRCPADTLAMMEQMAKDVLAVIAAAKEGS